MSVRDVVRQSFPDVELDRAPVRDDRLVAAQVAAEALYASRVARSWVPEYLASRRLDMCLDAGSRWQVGYAPADGRGLFRDRLMVSVRDADGVTVGFVGRANPADRRTPKYLNSPESSVYRKSELMLGLWEQRAMLRAGGTPVVVEGAFDAMAVTAVSGGRFVGVAPSGTAVTARQMRAVRNVSNAGVIFALDGDDAGRAAALRAYSAAHAAGFDRVDVVSMPDGQDPADLWASGTDVRFLRSLEDAEPLADRVVDARLDRWPHSLDNRQSRFNAARSVAGVIAVLPALEAARQVARVAHRLVVPMAVVSAAVADAVSPPEQVLQSMVYRGPNRGLSR